MSSRYVRRTVEDFIYAQFTTPYYSSVALDPTPSDPRWCSIDWGFAYSRRLTYCNENIFEGNFILVFFGLAGVGDDDLLIAAESDLEKLKNFSDSTGALVLESFSSADDFTQDRFYGVSFTIEYQHTVV